MIGDRLSSACFRLVHRNNLVYNTCWEDPRLDHAALDLGPLDRLVTITSAGCNALDYALAGPAEVHAVDVNPRQNALLELKLAGIRALDFNTFFGLFGRGGVRQCREVYHDALRPELPEFARRYWDRRIGFFDSTKSGSFYFRGSAGFVARQVNRYLDRVARVREAVDRILNAANVDEQREIYERRLRGAVWTRLIRWLMGRDATLSLLGVPRPQRDQVERDYAGGIATFIEDSVEAVFARLPLRDNYFWRVYLTGRYSETCCPEYLKRHNFERLKAGLWQRVRTHHGSLTDFLRSQRQTFTRFVLLDHMDWLAAADTAALAEEWRQILDRAAPGARILWRSGGTRSDFVDALPAWFRGVRCRVGELLTYNRDLARRLHSVDRVHTYGSFWIAQLSAI
ncbi:MAG: DUF3419 family protein [Planctomycetaceae bacterium]